jgi:hypothetical protein
LFSPLLDDLFSTCLWGRLPSRACQE